MKTKTPEPEGNFIVFDHLTKIFKADGKPADHDSDEDSDDDRRWIEGTSAILTHTKFSVKKPIKSVTPTELNRPVKSAPKEEKDVGSDLFGVTKPKPKFVSESDNREELDFELGMFFCFGSFEICVYR